MTFNSPRVSANPLLESLELLNVFDQFKVMNIIYIHKYFNANLPTGSLQTLVSSLSFCFLLSMKIKAVYDMKLII